MWFPESSGNSDLKKNQDKKLSQFSVLFIGELIKKTYRIYLCHVFHKTVTNLGILRACIR